MDGGRAGDGGRGARDERGLLRRRDVERRGGGGDDRPCAETSTGAAKDEFDVGYRHVAPRAPADEWFVGGVLAFGPGEEAPAMARMRELLARRVATQPLRQPNAGSVFRNPPGDHAARLVEASGLKGYTVGAAQVSTQHANFIVNLGGARAAEIEAVIEHVERTVRATTGVALVREVRIVGGPR